MRSRNTPYLFLAPFMSAFALFFVAPVLYALYLSVLVKKRVAFGPPTEVFGGLANYARALGDADFLQSFLNILLFGIVQVPVMLALATLFALLIDEGGGRLTRFFRTAVYIPYTVPSVVGGLLWGFLYSRNLSPLNFLLSAGGREPVDFLDSRIILFSVGNIVTWTWTGYNAITLYANLQSVPRELYEAAKVDGATALEVVRFIKLPLLRPALQLTLIFSVIGTSQIFSEPYVLRALGYVATNITPNTYLYQTATEGNYSYAAALAIVLALVTFSCSSFFLRLVNRRPV